MLSSISLTLFFILLSLLLSALFSGSEIAFISANKLRIEILKNKKKRQGRIIANFFDRPASFLGAMLVGNNTALVVFTSLMTMLLTDLFFPDSDGQILVLLFNTVVITIIVLIFGEFFPKTFFRLYASDLLFSLAIPLQILKFLLGIPTWIMIGLSNLILRFFFRTSIQETTTAFTRLDLENLVNTSRTNSEEEEIDKELFGNALRLKDLRVKDCVIPRTEIVHIDVEAPVEDLVKLIEETKLSRIIITEGDIDEVLGYVHHQQLMKRPTTIKEIILDILFIPEVARFTDVLSRFMKEQINIACVVDEFGAIAGIITLEDLLEEIFGEIEDEYDMEEHVENKISDTEFVFSGRLEIDYLNEKYKELNFPEGDYLTLSGYLVMTLENIPKMGSEIILDGYKFILELVSDTKIELVRVIKLEEGEES